MTFFSDFATGLFNFLHEKKINYNVLRNYEGLPEFKSGTDIDFLLDRRNMKDVLFYLKSIEEVTITGITYRDFITVVYLHGVNSGESYGIELDFIHKLALKGIDYLSVDDVLKRSRANANGILIPSLVDEAIISFYSSYLLCGFVKDQYFPFICETFEKYQAVVRNHVVSNFGVSYGNKLVDLVINQDIQSLLLQHKKFKWMYLVHSIRNPFTSISFRIKHYFIEMKLLVQRANSVRVVFLGPDGSGKSTVIENLRKRNRGIANDISVTYLKPNVLFKSREKDKTLTVDPHNVEPRGILTSALKLVFWSVEYQLDILKRKRNFTLEIYDRYYHDLYVDNIRYLYSGPRFLLKFMENFIPEPDIIFVLTAPVDVIQDRKAEVSFDECNRQIESYKEFANKRCNTVLITTDEDPGVVISVIESKIIKYMNDKAICRMK